jgi:DNA-binding response OmpR family regulator
MSINPVNASATNGHSSVVLLVEDEPADALMFSKAMQKAGFSVDIHVSRDGQDAIDYLYGVDQYADRGTYPLPDLIILDLKLPKASGFSVLRAVREHGNLQFIPALVLTSSNQDADVAMAYELGANSYLIKPVGFAQLVELVTMVGNYWFGMNLSPNLSSP